MLHILQLICRQRIAIFGALMLLSSCCFFLFFFLDSQRVDTRYL